MFAGLFVSCREMQTAVDQGADRRVGRVGGVREGFVSGGGSIRRYMAPGRPPLATGCTDAVCHSGMDMTLLLSPDPGADFDAQARALVDKGEVVSRVLEVMHAEVWASWDGCTQR